MAALTRSDILEEVGESNLAGSLDEALEIARTHLEARAGVAPASPAAPTSPG